MHMITVCSSMPRVGQIGDERGKPWSRFGINRVFSLSNTLLVQVPAVQRDFDERHADFDQAAGHHQAAAEVVVAVGGQTSGLSLLQLKAAICLEVIRLTAFL